MDYELFKILAEKNGAGMDRRYSHRNPQSPELYFQRSWTKSGMTGHGYTGDLESRPITPEREPELEELDHFLMEVCPNLSYLQYKTKVVANLTYDDQHHSGYYGDSSVDGVKMIAVKDLYQAIKPFLRPMTDEEVDMLEDKAEAERLAAEKAAQKEARKAERQKEISGKRANKAERKEARKELKKNTSGSEVDDVAPQKKLGKHSSKVAKGFSTVTGNNVTVKDKPKKHKM